MSIVAELVRRGVDVVAPSMTYVGAEVDPARIAVGVILHPGVRLLGAQLSIGPGCIIGEEGPVTLDNAQLGARVHVRSGFLSHSVCHDDVRLGGSLHIRPGCLLEESSSVAHAVGLKQTVLFPFVTLGSLINFCDVLMSGGRSASDHGEVGSSYVHFNFTPQHDKATASLIGDVPRGVLLREPPVFLGGQGGMVGPRRVGYGAIIPAGVILRRDVLQPGVYREPSPETADGSRTRDPAICVRVRNRFIACIEYLGHLRALREWYRHARPRLMADTPWNRALVAGGLAVIEQIRLERILRLEEWRSVVERSLAQLRSRPSADAGLVAEHESVLRDSAQLRATVDQLFASDPADEERSRALASMRAHPEGYVESVKALGPDASRAVTVWLDRMVADTRRWAGA